MEVGSSTCAFKPNPDGKQLLFEGELVVDDIENEGYPASVIYLYDFATKQMRRLSPKGLILSDPEWLPDGKSFVC